MTTLKAVEVSNPYYPALIEHCHDLMVVLASDGTIIYQSPSALRILGYRPDELVGRNVFPLIHPDDRQRVIQAFERARSERGETAKIEYRFQHKHETWRVLESVGSSVLGPDGIRVGIVNSRDITDRRTLEDRVQHAQRVATMGRIAGSVVHEFHNALQIMMLNLDYLVEAGTCPASVPELEDVRRSAEMATALARQLLDLGRTSDPDLRPADVNASVESMLPILQRLAGRPISVETRLRAEHSTISVPFGWVDQILVNLVGNARDAIQGQGRIQISTRNAGGRLIIDIDDDGVGIPLNLQDRIFDPFFTTKAGAQGTGLGLSVVRDLVEDAGGRIEVRSAVGCGATFTLTMPLADSLIYLDDDLPQLTASLAVRATEVRL